jgi:N-methylhydantoinase A/oxoprolinase/acetone carboxylase beta subunit
VTDADLVLGTLAPERFAPAGLRLDRVAAERALGRRVAAPLGLDLTSAAWGVREVFVSRLAELAGLVAAGQRRDPSTFTLVVGGGLGPAHGWLLARELGIEDFVVPAAAGAMAAAGVAAASPRVAVERAVHLHIPAGSALDRDELAHLKDAADEAVGAALARLAAVVADPGPASDEEELVEGAGAEEEAEVRTPTGAVSVSAVDVEADEAPEADADAADSEDVAEEAEPELAELPAGEAPAPSVELSVTLRYRGQTRQLTMPAGDQPIDESFPSLVGRFEAEHAARFGFGSGAPAAEAGLEVLRVLAVASRPPEVFEAPERRAGRAFERSGHRVVVFESPRRPVDTPVYAADQAAPDQMIEGPCLLELPGFTVAVPPGGRASTDALGNVHVHVPPPRRPKAVTAPARTTLPVLAQFNDREGGEDDRLELGQFDDSGTAQGGRLELDPPAAGTTTELPAVRHELPGQQRLTELEPSPDPDSGPHAEPGFGPEEPE